MSDNIFKGSVKEEVEQHIQGRLTESYISDTLLDSLDETLKNGFDDELVGVSFKLEPDDGVSNIVEVNVFWELPANKRQFKFRGQKGYVESVSLTFEAELAETPNRFSVDIIKITALTGVFFEYLVYGVQSENPDDDYAVFTNMTPDYFGRKSIWYNYHHLTNKTFLTQMSLILNKYVTGSQLILGLDSTPYQIVN